MARRALARVNLAAIERNTAALRARLAPGTALCAVVKADGYGHGAVPAARAAQAGGADWLAVATAGEARGLREAAVAGRIVVLGALDAEELPDALAAEAEVVAWNEPWVRRLGARVAEGERPVGVHVKLDTGMGRLGTRDPEQARRTVELVAATEGLELVGVLTHFATADERGDPFFDLQRERFAAWVDVVRDDHPGVVAHAANSAAVLRDPAAHFDLVRPGLALYGLDPFAGDPAEHGLEPALQLESYVAEVKPCAPGESAGYGRRFVAERATHVGVLPIGYGDGWRRGLTNRADVLLGGVRHPLVGTVSMDNVTVDLGAHPRVGRGAPAVLIGAQGRDRIGAEEVAARLDTINYEVTCAISARVPRLYHRDGAPG